MYPSPLPSLATVSLDMLEDLEDTVSHIAQGLHKDSVKVGPVKHTTSASSHWMTATIRILYVVLLYTTCVA